MRSGRFKNVPTEDTVTAFLLLLLTLVGPWVWGWTTNWLLAAGRRAFDASAIVPMGGWPSGKDLLSGMQGVLGALFGTALLALGGGAWLWRHVPASAYASTTNTGISKTVFFLLVGGLALLFLIPLWHGLLIPATANLASDVARLVRILFALTAGITLIRILVR